MSTEGYHSPRVEDILSEVGDRPPKKTSTSSKRDQPPPSSGAAGTKAATARSASDSGYSSKTAGTANSSSLNGSVKEDIAIQDVRERDTRRPMPYSNTHEREKDSVILMPRKESLGMGATKKAKPKAMTRRPEPGAMAQPPLPPAYQKPYASAQHQRPLPLRVSTTNTPYTLPPSPMGPPPTPNIYQQHNSPAYSSAGFPQFPSYPNSAAHRASQEAHMPIYGPSQPTQHSYHQSLPRQYVMAHPTYTPLSSPYPQTHYPAYPPAPSPGFAMPVHPQRPPPPISRHTAPVLSQGPPPHFLQYTPVSNPRDPQALIMPSLRRQRHVEQPMIPAQRPRLKQKAHRHRSRECDSDNDRSSSSSYTSSSSPSSSDGRTSPRKALRKARSAGTTRPQPSRSRRHDPHVPNRRSGDSTFQDEEKARIAVVESYQRETATPQRRQIAAPRYIEDTARATKAASSRQSDDSPTPLSPTRSRTSASCSDNRSRRDSLIVSTQGQLTYRQTEDGYSFDAPEGQQITLTISNGKEKRYIEEGSNSNASQSRRRGSTAGTNRTRESSFVRRARGFPQGDADCTW